MGWKQCEKPKTTLANAALVREFVDMDPAPYDRPLSEKRLLVYQRILKSGEFRPVTWASAVCLETNNTYRVNGKHTATMLSGYNPLPEFFVTVERYVCDTLNDVASLYNTFDSNLSNRTTSDINLAFAATVPALRAVPKHIINLSVSSLAAQKWSDTEVKSVPPAERAEELLDNCDFVAWLHKMLPGESGGRRQGAATSHGATTPLRRVPVASAMLATYRKGPRLAEEFWLLVRDETAADRDDPSRTLARFLARAAMMGGSRSALGSGKQIVSTRELYAKCIHGWNAWRKGEATSLKYHAKAPLPQPVK